MPLRYPGVVWRRNAGTRRSGHATYSGTGGCAGTDRRFVRDHPHRRRVLARAHGARADASRARRRPVTGARVRPHHSRQGGAAASPGAVPPRPRWPPSTARWHLPAGRDATHDPARPGRCASAASPPPTARPPTRILARPTTDAPTVPGAGRWRGCRQLSRLRDERLCPLGRAPAVMHRRPPTPTWTTSSRTGSTSRPGHRGARLGSGGRPHGLPGAAVRLELHRPRPRRQARHLPQQPRTAVPVRLLHERRPRPGHAGALHRVRLLRGRQQLHGADLPEPHPDSEPEGDRSPTSSSTRCSSRTTSARTPG